MLFVNIVSSIIIFKVLFVHSSIIISIISIMNINKYQNGK